MLKEMAKIAVECLKTPNRNSAWSPELGKYVCPDHQDARMLEATTDQQRKEAAKHPSINPQFKLVFLTATAGTFLFVVLCLVLTLIAGKEPPPLFEKVVMGFFDLAKIGFGAVVGLLGVKKLQGDGVEQSTS